jgi:hypothetical protein
MVVCTTEFVFVSAQRVFGPNSVSSRAYDLNCFAAKIPCVASMFAMLDSPVFCNREQYMTRRATLFDTRGNRPHFVARSP